MFFCGNLCEKRQIWVSDPHFGKVRGDARPWLMTRKPMVDFLFAWLNFIHYLLRFRSYEAKCVQLGCFRRGRPLCTQILSGQGRPPSTILGTRKLERHWATRRWRLHPSVLRPVILTQHWSVTDRQICRI